jgi:hypothetical protein
MSKKQSFETQCWNEQLARSEGRVVVMEREGPTHYRMRNQEDAGPFRGFGGQLWIVHFLDGRVVETRDLWCQGLIPKRFQKRMPVNARLCQRVQMINGEIKDLTSEEISLVQHQIKKFF